MNVPHSSIRCILVGILPLYSLYYYKLQSLQNLQAAGTAMKNSYAKRVTSIIKILNNPQTTSITIEHFLNR